MRVWEERSGREEGGDVMVECMVVEEALWCFGRKLDGWMDLRR